MVGETISHYRSVEKLGQGGLRVVYKAEDLTLDRLVALKFLAFRLVSDDDSHKRFIREAKMSGLCGRPVFFPAPTFSRLPTVAIWLWGWAAWSLMHG